MGKVMVGGFGLCGVPRTLLDEVVKRPELKDLDVYSNNLGTPGRGVGLLAREGRVRSITGSFLVGNREFGDQFFRGEVQLNLCPQGTFAERIRAGAAGIPAFYTPTGYGTAVHKGELVLKYEKKEGEEAKPVLISKPRESRRFGNRDFILEEAIYGDYALIHARKADEAGNLISTPRRVTSMTLWHATRVLPLLRWKRLCRLARFPRTKCICHPSLWTASSRRSCLWRWRRCVFRSRRATPQSSRSATSLLSVLRLS